MIVLNGMNLKFIMPDGGAEAPLRCLQSITCYKVLRLVLSLTFEFHTY